MKEQEEPTITVMGPPKIDQMAFSKTSQRERVDDRRL